MGSQSFRMIIFYIFLFTSSMIYVLLEIYNSKNDEYKSFLSISIGILLFFTLICFFTSSLTDPGILKVPLTENEYPKEKNLQIKYKNNSIALKYCNICKIFRSLRAHHCKICDVCIEEMDQHCVWIGNCVGKRNKRSFFLFLFFYNLLVLEILVLSIYNLSQEQPSYSNQRLIYSLIFIVFMSFIFLSSFTAFILQIYLISISLNACEYIKGDYLGDRNIFTEGWKRNWLIFCKKRREHRDITLDYLQKKEFSDRSSMNQGDVLNTTLDKKF